MTEADRQVASWNSCVAALSRIRGELADEVSHDDRLDPKVRLEIRDLVRRMAVEVGVRKNYPTLVARLPTNLTQWVASLGPCGTLATNQLPAQFDVDCNMERIRTRLRDDVVEGIGTCHDFDVARSAAIAFCSSLGTSAIRELVLKSLLNRVDDVGSEMSAHERKTVGLAQRLYEKTPATQAAMLTELVDDRTDFTIAEVALRAAIETGAADDVAYWRLAQLLANRDEFGAAVALVDAGMSHLTSVTDMRRILKKAQKWSVLSTSARPPDRPEAVG